MEGPFSESELEFLAEEEFIRISPLFNMDEVLNCITADYGPFRSQCPVLVPLWMAIYLKDRKMCKIDPPEWLDVKWLTEKLKIEREEPGFQWMPYHYIEMSSLLLTHAADDIDGTQRIKVLLADLQNVRSAKVRLELRQVHAGRSFLKLNNLAAMEIHEIREFCVQSMDAFFELSRAEVQPSEPQGSRRSQSPKSDFRTGQNQTASAVPLTASIY